MFPACHFWSFQVRQCFISAWTWHYNYGELSKVAHLISFTHISSCCMTLQPHMKLTNTGNDSTETCCPLGHTSAYSHSWFSGINLYAILCSRRSLLSLCLQFICSSLSWYKLCTTEHKSSCIWRRCACKSRIVPFKFASLSVGNMSTNITDTFIFDSQSPAEPDFLIPLCWRSAPLLEAVNPV